MIYLANYFVQPWRSHSRGEVFSTNLPLRSQDLQRKENKFLTELYITRENISILIIWESH